MNETVATSERLIIAIDTADLARAQSIAAAVVPHCGLLKLGLEFVTAHGPQGVRAMTDIKGGGRPLFLDLKFADIPNTVAGAVRAVLPLRPRMLTLHAAGGAAMIDAARRASEAAGADRPLLLAVTVLTSLDAAALAATGVVGDPRRQVLLLAKLALAAGADGVVCAGHEIAALRDALGAEPAIVVPGIRSPGEAAADQARTMSPQDAVAAGADWVVIGRPITTAPDPAEAARAIAVTIKPH